MPGITVNTSRLPKDKRDELIRELATTASRITGIPISFFHVYVNEFSDDCIGVGGETVEELKAKRAAAQR